MICSAKGGCRMRVLPKSLAHRAQPRQGASRIVQELKQQGVADDQVIELREQLRATEYARALAVWQKQL